MHTFKVLSIGLCLISIFFLVAYQVPHEYVQLGLRWLGSFMVGWWLGSLAGYLVNKYWR